MKYPFLTNCTTYNIKAMKNIYLKSGILSSFTSVLLATTLFLCCSFLALGQVPVPFTQRTSQYTPTKVIYHIQGDFQMIGNTNLTLQNYTPTTPNSNNNMIFVDADGNSSTTNSSSADLTFSTENGAIPSCSKIIYAGLYWSGRAAPSMPETTKRNIKVRGPGQASYQSFTANASNILYPNDPNYSHMYCAYVEVTDLVKQYGIGTYWVADMALTQGMSDGTGYYGGWGIIVVYENSKMKWRDVTIFDGYAYISSQQSGSYDFPVSGFNAVQSGPVNMKLGVVAGEGDQPYVGDFFAIRNHANTAWIDLSDGCNTTSNFFNSSVCTGGNARNPNLVNNTGIDIHMFSIPNTGNSIIANNQTSTSFQYRSTQDTYVIFCMAMAVDAYVPQPEALNTVQSIGGVAYIPGNPLIALPGNQIQCKVDIRNKGTEAIDNTKVIIPIPYASSYVSCSKVVNFAPLPTPNNLYFDPTLGANGSIVWDMGTLPLPASPSTILATLTFTIQATTDCNILSNPTCPPSISIDGTLSGTGATSGTTFSDLGFISGYLTSGTCVGEPIYDPIQISIDAVAYIAAHCPTQTNQAFTYCNAGSSIPITSISGNFPPGSRFYNSFPVTLNSIEYTITHPFPATSGTITYYAVPPGTSSCYFVFTITVTNIISTPTVSSVPVTYCQGAVAVPLTATASNPSYTLYYYTSLSSLPVLSLTPSTAVSGSYTYYVAEGISGSCISPNKVPITVFIYALPTATAGGNSPVCLGGTLYLTASGAGTGGSYSWIGPNGFTSSMHYPSIWGVTTQVAGTYTVTVTNENGCTGSASVAVTTNTPITLMVSHTSATCGQNNGTATVSASGGAAPYSYMWSNFVTSNSIGPVAAGFYSVTVTDANNCFSVAHTIIGQSGTLNISLLSQTNVLCWGNSTGSISVTGVGGTGPYQYNVNGGIYQPSGTFSGLPVGTYNITVKDAFGCLAFLSTDITGPAQLKIKTSETGILCHGGTSLFDVSASGGVTPYVSGTGQFAVGQGSHTFTPWIIMVAQLLRRSW
jgi:hypothetical protein